MCMDGLLQLLMMLAKPGIKLIPGFRTLIKPKVSEPLLNRIYSTNLEKNTCKLH